jgi:hypothetical protein
MNPDPVQVTERLYNLLPVLYRLRDAENGYPLRELVAVVAEQVAAVQESLEKAYDDLFIETCAPWIVPYLGDLIGARPLHNKAPGTAGGRAEVAETLGLRRRKGTLAALEQSARVVTGFPAVAVEFFTRMALTQWMNHARPENHYTANLRDVLALEYVGGPFDPTARTLEVRRISSRRGRYNLPNVGLFLFRIRSFELRGATAARLDDFRWRFNPLGIDTAVYNDPVTETAITHFAGPENTPLPISRAALKADLASGASAFYGPSAPLLLEVDGSVVPVEEVVACNLKDKADGSGDWLHAPADVYGIDPVLGRIAMPASRPAPGVVVVNFRYGFSDELGGGAYERGAELQGAPTQVVDAAAPDLQAALDASTGGGIVEFADSRTYELASSAPNLSVDPDQVVEIRAANGQRPLVRVTGGEWVIEGGAGATIVLNGLAIAGGALRITGDPAAVILRHCTLVPGLERTQANEPAQPDAPSLVIEPENVTVTIDRCICGPIQAANGCVVVAHRSIFDAADETRPVFYGTYNPVDGSTTPGGALDLADCTIVGRVHTQRFLEATNVIFAARAPTGTALLPVRSERTQDGCMRFSAIPAGARTPRRYRCTGDTPRFTSLRFGVAAYAQLSVECPETIRAGAEDESEMGVFHDLYLPQRESDLRTRLEEYLRYGMEAGIFYAS